MVKIGMIISDRYEIIEKIGTGGMSDVYKALDNKLNRNVAVKVLKQEFGDNENFVSKFRVEAQAAAGLMHSNIVNVYDVGEENEIHYIVMELVEGITLKKYIEKKARLTYKEAVSIAIQVSLGIEAAHANHIIHRDIKPQNIIISKDGKVKVTDFGIAKAATSNTITSNVMGSVHYTSPEQARGGYSDEKSDIYSLGISMFEMITGRVPFNGDTTVAIAIKHIQEEMPSPKEYVPEIPDCVESIIFKCTEKSPDRRYQSMAELIVDLKQALLTPETNFVVREDPLMSGGTRVIDTDEVTRIKSGSTSRALGETEKLMTLASDVTGNSSAGSRADGYDEQYSESGYEGYDENYSQENGYDQGYEGQYENGYEGGEYVESAYTEDNYSGESGLENEDEYSPKAERITTIVAIIIGVVIIGVIIVLAVTLFGKMSGRPSVSNPDSQGPVIDDTDIDVPVEMVMIPMLVGMNVDDVRNSLFTLGINLVATYEASDEIASGIIISAKDENGLDVAVGEEMPKGASIYCVVSSGKGGIELPSVENATYEAAKNALEKMGFSVVKLEQPDAAVQEGFVISQSPAANEVVPEGSTITLTVSTGPEIKSVRVPNLTGFDVEEATLEIVEAGLSVGTVTEVNSETIAKGIVCGQSIESGTYVDEKTVINISVSLGSAVITYKYEADIDGPTTEEAPDYQSGMSVNVTLSTDDGKVLMDTNVTSFPIGGTYYGLTAPGGTVTLTYSVPGDPVITNGENGEQITVPGEPINKTITRKVTFIEETKATND